MKKPVKLFTSIIKKNRWNPIGFKLIHENQHRINI